MSKTFWSGFATTGLTTACGTFLLLAMTLHGSIASNPKANLDSQEDLPTIPSTVINDRQPILPETPTTISIATVASHRWQGKLAVTLRIRDIPVLTFLGTTKDVSANQVLSDSTPDPKNPMVRANVLANRLNQFVQDPNFDANQIGVSWDKSRQSYLIKVANEEIATIDNATMLPDSTRNRRLDALQATNRLRRLLGDAAPLRAVANISNTESLSKNAKATLRSSSQTLRGGVASWYGPGFHGRLTANGERYNQRGLTAAHKTLPFGTKVRVTNLRNGQSVIVRINDRGPFSRGRVIDLSAGAAQTIGVLGSGVAPVQLEVLLP